ncbi:hypothetical protein [Aquibium microcysteis]|uniref:hypothetical protein n=1 Tax=Aquibium microcysteis TaxID=675281 RepID=UPI00165D0255|nr:hypothetical protein [Aquibium microcysteis]
MISFLKRLIGRMSAEKPAGDFGISESDPPTAVVTPMLRHFANEAGTARNGPAEADILRIYQETEATLRNLRS